jgi:hypothetical protein
MWFILSNLNGFNELLLVSKEQVHGTFDPPWSISSSLGLIGWGRFMIMFFPVFFFFFGSLMFCHQIAKEGDY